MKCVKCGVEIKLPKEFTGFIDGRCDCGKRFGTYVKEGATKAELEKDEVKFVNGRIV